MKYTAGFVCTCIFLLFGCSNGPLAGDDAANAIKKFGGTVEQRRGIVVAAIFQGECANDEAVRLCCRIPELKNIGFHNSSLTKNGFQDIWSLQQLEGLQIINDKNISDSNLIGIGKLLNLRHLILESDSITDNSLTEIGKLTELGVLGLGNTTISDAGLMHLNKLAKLNSLAINSTNISGSGLKYLSGLTEIRNLILSDTLINDDGLEDIASISGLQHLKLERTKVTDNCFIKLIKLHDLGIVYLGGTQVSLQNAKAFQKLWKEELLKAVDSGEIYIKHPEERMVRVILN